MNSAGTLPSRLGKGFASWVGVVLIGVVAMVGLSGCGYTSQTLYPKDVQSVQVDIFANRTFYRGAEFDLTEALSKQIELKTPYKVVSGRRADTLLEGTIVAINQRLLSRRHDGGLPQQLEMQVIVDFTWRNLRTGKVITDRKGLMAVGRYVPPVGQVQATGQHEAMQAMADRIVAALAEQW